MAFYFSSDTKALYDTDVFPVGSLPANKVEITEASYIDLMTKQNQGYVILADGSGNPYTVNQSEAAATDIKHAASVATTLALGHVKIGNTMTAANDGTLDLKDGAVTTDKIADGSVTEEKMDSLKDLVADEDTLTMTEDSNAFTFSVKDGGIGTTKIADGATTTAKIADGATTTAKIADGATTTAKIADGAVTRAKMDASALPKILSATCNESESYTTNNQYFEIGSISDNDLISRISDISLSGKIKLDLNSGSSFDVTIYVYNDTVSTTNLIETRTITVTGPDKSYFNERFLIDKNLIRSGLVVFFVRINLSGTIVSFSEKRLKGILL